MVKNLGRFQRQIRAIPSAVRAEVRKQLEKEAEKIVRLMRAFAPKGTTRRLVESIGWTWGDAPDGTMALGQVADEPGGLAITIYAGGGDAFYARFQEFGRVKMPANPFFYPVWRGERRRARAGIRRAVKRGIAKAKQA